MATWMRWSIRFTALIVFAAPGVARLKDIHTDKLPQQESVQRALAEASAVEEFAQSWSEKWQYDKPKDDVVSALKDSLDKLQRATVSAPGNAELFLLIGVVAHYAYNVDVSEAYDVAVGSLQKAHQLAPDDYRAEWFLGVYECEGAQVDQGMAILLAVEKHVAWDQLPPDFWDDYMFCAYLANMPAHLLRAEDHLSKLNAPPSHNRDFLVEMARKRFKPSDPAAAYTDREAWESKNQNSRLIFTSYVCGFSFSPLADWRLRRLDVEKGICFVQIETGPHSSKGGNVIPNLLVLVRQPKPGETLSDFAISSTKGSMAKAVQASHCPSDQCLSYEKTIPGGYGARGNGYGLFTVFKREAPEFPGLLFEEPSGPPAPNDGKVTYYRPNERLHRLDGTLYYLVLLDTADSVLDKASQDYAQLLQYMVAE